MIDWKLRQKVLIGLLCFLLGCYIDNLIDDSFDIPNKEIILKDTCMHTKEKNTDSLTKENVYNYILDQNIQFPKIVMAQVLLETGHLKSNVCKKYNNLFGFLTSKGYLKFKHWKESVEYYKNWQITWYSGGNYYQFLTDIGYAEDMKDYIKKLKQIKV